MLSKLIQLMKMINTMGLQHLLNINKGHKFWLPLIRGYMASRAVCSLLNLGFFNDLLQEKKLNISEYSIRRGLNKDVLYAICNYLYALKILDKEDNDCFLLNRRMANKLNVSKGTFYLLYAYDPIFQNLEDLLQNKKYYGKEVLRRGEFVGKGSGEAGKWMPFPVALKLIKACSFKKVLDLGCGDAEFLISICRENGIFGYGVDISPDVIKYAESKIKKEKLNQKITVEVGDIFNLGPLSKKWSDIDVITSMYVLHEFIYAGDNKVLEILGGIKNCYKDVPILICELCEQPIWKMRKNSTGILEHHLFHSLSNQRIYSISKWKEVFKKVGYRVIEEIRFDIAGQGYFLIK